MMSCECHVSLARIQLDHMSLQDLVLSVFVTVTNPSSPSLIISVRLSSNKILCKQATSSIFCWRLWETRISWLLSSNLTSVRSSLSGCTAWSQSWGPSMGPRWPSQCWPRWEYCGWGQFEVWFVYYEGWCCECCAVWFMIVLSCANGDSGCQSYVYSLLVCSIIVFNFPCSTEGYWWYTHTFPFLLFFIIIVFFFPLHIVFHMW